MHATEIANPKQTGSTLPSGDGTLPSGRGECPECGRPVLVRRDGLLKAHRAAPSIRTWCAGSLRPVANPKQTPSTLLRPPRCRLLDARSDRCPNETLSEDGIPLCAHHLAQAAQDFARLTSGADFADLLHSFATARGPAQAALTPIGD